MPQPDRPRFPGYFKIFASKKFRSGFALTGLGLVLLASVGPLVGQLSSSGYWPGFFYAPFYTANVFSDPTTPAGAAGLRPEDRVIGLRPARIERLAELTDRAGAVGGKVTLIYELGRELTSVEVPVTRLDWGRGAEKAGPLLVAGLLLVGLGWQKRQGWAGLVALPLLAAPDYWLNPGAGRESGFDPAHWLANGQFLFVSAKWSSFLYWPLWTLAWAGLSLSVAGQLFQFQKRAGGLARALILTALAAELAAYLYDAIKTATYNNPDYVIWHARAVFWPGWGLLLGLTGLWAWRKQTWAAWVGLLGLALFVAGFAFPTTFDTALPGPGPQWYALALLILGLGSGFRTQNLVENRPVVGKRGS